MAAGIESRVPFMDYRIVEFANRAADRAQVRQRHRQGASSRTSPAPCCRRQIVDRRKSGFGVPLARWFRADDGLGERITALPDSAARRHLRSSRCSRRVVAEHRTGAQDHSELLWTALNPGDLARDASSAKSTRRTVSNRNGYQHVVRVAAARSRSSAAARWGINHVRAIRACPIATLVGVADPGRRPRTTAADARRRAELFKRRRRAARRGQARRRAHRHAAGDRTPSWPRCAWSGAHVYVEKPFTLTAAEARSVIRTARGGQSLGLRRSPAAVRAPARALSAELHDDRPRRARRELLLVSRRCENRATAGRRCHRSTSCSTSCRTRSTRCSTRCGPRIPRRRRSRHRSRCAPRAKCTRCSRAGDATAMLVVTLRGRPVESYLRVVGTNGSLRADFVRGALIAPPGAGTSAISILSNPYREATQMLVRIDQGVCVAHPPEEEGLSGADRIDRRVLRQHPSRVARRRSRRRRLIDTVRVCEHIGHALRGRRPRT